MEKRKILFVDDDISILAGLSRMLRSMRKDFDIHFVENSEEALKLMCRNEFDIVVADMRLPGMDGTDLLTEIKEKYPHSIRIVLTGQTDDASALRTVAVAHQFLTKPCEPEKLKDILIRSGALHKLISNGKLKDLISSLETLPSLPSIYTRLQNKIREPETSLDDIGEIISADIAMTAKILQLVNSAFFGLYPTVDSPARAVKLLGLDIITALALGTKIFSEIKISGRLFSAEFLWRHSLTVGALAKRIAENETGDKNIVSDSFIAGILHDIGKLILVSEMETSYSDAVFLAQKEKISLRLAETQIFKATHCGIGAYLTGLWGFNNNIVEAIGFHHQLDKYPADTFSPALAVHIANAIYYRYYQDEVIGATPEFNEVYLDMIGLSGKLQKWQDLCFASIEQKNSQ